MKNKGINVLSLFDGMSCGQIALEREDISVENYYASEIDKNSIKVTQKNYSNTVQLGDVTKLSSEYLNSLDIDLLIGGSPCQNLSITVINNPDHNQGLEGDKSKLFYEYVRVLKAIKPKYFLFENVASMKNTDRDIISEVLGVEPIMIDSALVSAQDRKRYYWTNIPNITQPAAKIYILDDILEDASDIEDKYWYKQSFDFHGDDKKVIGTLHINGHDIIKRIHNTNGKCATLTACRGGNKQKKVLQGGVCRKLTPLEYERLQTVPEGYTDGVADTHRYNMLGDGWTIDVITHILKGVR